MRLTTLSLVSLSLLAATSGCGGSSEAEGGSNSNGADDNAVDGSQGPVFRTVDANNDGEPDMIDLDMDGEFDGIGVDTDGDGIVDAVGLDTDDDGVIDAIDTDGDGLPDGAGDGGGSGGQSGDTGSGGGAATTDPNPAEDCVGGFVLEDFESDSTSSLFRPYSDGSAGGTMTPAAGVPFQPEMSSDSGSLALHMQGSGFTSWGAGIGRAFEAPVACKERSVGLRFKAKGNGMITFAGQVSAVIPVAEGGSCTAGDGCNNGHQTQLNLGATWKTYEVLWSDLAQITGTGWESLLTSFDPRSVQELLFAARPEAMPFDFWIDDIELIDDGSPVDPVDPDPNPDPDPGTGGTGGDPDPDPDPSACVLDGILGEAGFNSWFASRRNPFYTYANLCTALEGFPGFANSGNATLDKREVAAFFANVARETGELDYIEQIVKSPPTYFGRGPLQLTWDYNYRAAGDFLGIDLVSDPDRVARDGVVTWQTALWFWMHADGAGKGTCNGAIIQGRGFGQTINVINGGLECPSSGNSAAQERISYFKDYCGRLGVDLGGALDC